MRVRQMPKLGEPLESFQRTPAVGANSDTSSVPILPMATCCPVDSSFLSASLLRVSLPAVVDSVVSRRYHLGTQSFSAAMWPVGSHECCAAHVEITDYH
jgi:hypothetical protein